MKAKIFQEEMVKFRDPLGEQCVCLRGQEGEAGGLDRLPRRGFSGWAALGLGFTGWLWLLRSTLSCEPDFLVLLRRKEPPDHHRQQFLCDRIQYKQTKENT